MSPHVSRRSTLRTALPFKLPLNHGVNNMKVNRILLVAIFLSVARSANAQDWQKIVPLETTPAGVEKLLGPAEVGYLAIYELKEGNLSIEFSSGSCRPDRKGGWNVPANVVVNVFFSPKKKRRLSDLKLNRRKFRKVVDRHVGGITYYINDENGVVYEVQEGKVESVEYGPPKKYVHLHCGESPGTSPPNP